MFLNLVGEVPCATCMICMGSPVFAPPAAACQAFHPGVPATSGGSGWREAVYCNYNDGAACASQQSCHDCPACLVGYLGCGYNSSTQMEALYVECQ